MATLTKATEIEVLIQGHWLRAHVTSPPDAGETIFCATLEGPSAFGAGLDLADEGVMWRLR